MIILRMFNRLVFRSTFSLFEIVAFFIIGNLIELSVWWILGFIPVILVSSFMQAIIEEEEE